VEQKTAVAEIAERTALAIFWTKYR